MEAPSKSRWPLVAGGRGVSVERRPCPLSRARLVLGRRRRGPRRWVVAVVAVRRKEGE